jgi:hypothetical protein
MFSYVFREMRDGFLIGLEKLVGRIPCQGVTQWRFHDISLTSSKPFGMLLKDFEEKSRNCPEGVCVSNEAFFEFLRTDFQILDGCIEGRSGPNGKNSLFTLDCFDTSQWEATTEDESIAVEFEKKGWNRQ